VLDIGPLAGGPSTDDPHAAHPVSANPLVDPATAQSMHSSHYEQFEPIRPGPEVRRLRLTLCQIAIPAPPFTPGVLKYPLLLEGKGKKWEK